MLYTYKFEVYQGDTGTIAVAAHHESAAKNCAKRVLRKQYGSSALIEIELISTDYTVAIARENDYGFDGSKKYIPSEYSRAD